MKEDIQHQQYREFAPGWVVCRDCYEGSRTIKKKEKKYLPKLSKSSNESYANYLFRALFDPIYQDIINTLCGAVFRKETKFVKDLGEKEEEQLKSITNDGVPYSVFESRVLENVLITGRYGVLTDMDKAGKRIWFSGYRAEQILNWYTEVIDGVEVLVYVCLEEEESVFDPKDHVIKSIIQRRVLKLVDNQYVVELWRKPEDKSDWEIHDTLFPLKDGKPLDFIPFITINHNDLTPDATESPTYGIAAINISHYTTSADLENGLHFAGLPTLFITGVPEDKKITVGAQTFISVTNTGADAKFIEYEGKGLSELTGAITTKKDSMYRLGLKFGEQPAGVESLGSQKMRRHNGSNSLSKTVNVVESGINQLFIIMADWGKFNTMLIDINEEFVEAQPDFQMINTLQSLVASGHMSEKVFFHNMFKWGLYPKDHTIETELEEIDKGLSRAFPLAEAQP